MAERGRRPGSITASELPLRAQVTLVQLSALKRGSLGGSRGLIAAAGASYYHFIQYVRVRGQGLRMGSKTGSGESWRPQR